MVNLRNVKSPKLHAAEEACVLDRSVAKGNKSLSRREYANIDFLSKHLYKIQPCELVMERSLFDKPDIQYETSRRI